MKKNILIISIIFFFLFILSPRATKKGHATPYETGETAINPPEVTVYPNPLNYNYLTIKSKGIVKVEITNLLGQKIYNFNNPNPDEERMTVYVEELTHGIYMLKITFTTNESVYKKLIIK